MATSTPSFTGALDANGKFAGWGTLRYDEEGTVYEGDFSDGQCECVGFLSLVMLWKRSTHTISYPSRTRLQFMARAR